MKAFSNCARQSLLRRYRILSLIMGLLMLSVLGLLLRQPVWNITGKVFASKPASKQESYGLSDYASVRVSDRGNNRVNLTDGHDVLAAYSGEEEIKQALQQNLASPLAPGSADFDEDGVADLVIGYAIPEGGIIALYRGNVDAIFPNAPEAKQRKARGEFNDSPFLSPARVFKLPLQPDFVCAGDFDGDGRMDVAAAMRGSNALCLLAGDGTGNFGAVKQIVLPGSITALKAGEINRRDGLMDIVVGVAGAKGPKVILYEGAEGALRANPEQFALPAQATDFAFGQFDNEYPNDLVIASGSDMLLLRGRDKKLPVGDKQAEVSKAIIESRSFPFTIRSLAVGDFTGNHQTELSMLSSDGSVYLLSQTRKTKANNIKGLKIEKLIADAGRGFAQLIKARVSSLPVDDLVAVDPANHQVRIIETTRREGQSNSLASAAAAIDLVVEGEPVAVLPMRLNGDALNDLVILRIGQSAPAVVPSASNAVINVTSNADNGVGTLRDAITIANGNAGADTINFAIGTGPQTISLVTPLPDITEAVTLDGTTQPSFAGTSLIELNGAGVPAGGSGLSILSGNCTVRALVINRFTANIGSGGVGIFMQPGGNNLLEGNFIGTDSAGNAALGNFIGVLVSNSSNNTVGGTTAAARNVISGNNDQGIFLKLGATANLVQGNFIGTDVTGASALSNGVDGVKIDTAPDNTIGGTAAGARNVISGNAANGILIREAGTTEILVQGNFIGVALNGVTPLANAQQGVTIINNASGNSIGGAAAGQGNRIAFNTLNGVLINAGAINNGIQSNSIFSNGLLGIDLNNDGVTPNDAGDGDAGANNLQNFPVITAVSSGVGSTTIQGTFNSIQNSNFRLEFFSSATCDGSGNGEGQTFIGSTNVLTNGSGNANINVMFPVSVAPGNVVTSTATNTANNTSEFSQCFNVPLVSCVINCPANITLNASQTQCGAVASYPAPNASAGCGTVTCLPPPGTFFPVGATTVNCMVQAGPSCSFTIAVLDNTPPSITCPSNVVTATAPGRQNAIVDYPLATATDACGAVTVTCLPPSGTAFPIGATAVNCAATDSANNSSICAFTVTVIDSEPPAIRCPNNIAVDAPSSQNTVAVNYPAPTATDNSPNVVVACIPPPGSAFPLGTTAVNCVATDSAGNRSSCGFNVTVSGGPPAAQVIIEGGAAAIEFGRITPVPVNKKPAKNKNNPCGLFTIQNTGSVTLRLTLDSINRIGSDVDARKITDPKESDFYLLSELNSDGTESPIPVGSTVALRVREQKNFCLRFSPVIPAVAASIASLSAPQVVPNLVNSRVTFLVAGGNPLAVNVNAHIETGVKFINPDKPKKAAAVTLSRSGNEFTATFSVFDSNADVNRAKYEFLNANGAVIETIEVELSQVLKEKNLVRGQSFTVTQRFTGANSHPEVKGVRITVFDGESNVSLTTNNLLQSAQAQAFKSQGGSRAANISPPVVRLNETVP